MFRLLSRLVLSLGALLFCLSAFTAETYYTVAVLPFTEKGAGVANMGSQASDLLFVELSKQDNIYMVERDQIEKIMNELQLNASGIVSQENAAKIGEMTGAKILITGSVFKVKDKTFIVGKVIGTETSRVCGCSADGSDNVKELTDKLSKDIASVLSKKAADLMPVVKEKKNIIEDLKSKIGDAQKPKLFIKIVERHVGRNVIDPAAQTEMEIICKELGFELVTNEVDADIVVKGEGLSEFGIRHGNLTSVRARVEVKATDKNNKIIAVDKQTDMSVGLDENITGKDALQKASAKIAERMIPKLVKK